VGEVIGLAKRRKVSNLLALTLLSQLMERPMYPYEMAARLRERGKDQAIKINWGSLYTVVQNLEKNGFITAVQVAREGRQPERTTYQITEAGQAELKDWLRELVGEPEREYSRLEAGLSDIGNLPPDEVVGLLRQRLRVLDAVNDQTQAELAKIVEQVPRLFLIESEYNLAMRKAEAEWVRGVLAEFDNGTFPGMEFWQFMHDNGVLDGSGKIPELPEGLEVPPAIREILERGGDTGQSDN
jgi:DNA-binding PadR family transcriptional regulator